MVGPGFGLGMKLIRLLATLRGWSRRRCVLLLKFHPCNDNVLIRCSREVVGISKRDKYYKQCFGVDIWGICGAKKLQNPVVPKFEPWVRLFVIEDVRVEDVKKFVFN